MTIFDENYLKINSTNNFKFTYNNATNKNISTTLISKLNENIWNVLKINENINQTILNNQFDEIFKNIKPTKNKSYDYICNNLECKKNNLFWYDCKEYWDNCFKILKKLINIEVNSTAYMLRILINSIIINTNDNKPHEFEFKFTDHNKITGIWKNDKDFISIIKKIMVLIPF